MTVEGVDYAWDRPNISGLFVAGKRFACRYGGPGSIGKQLDATEARALSAAGIAIVANAEGDSDGLLGGYSAGADWARRAQAHFLSCGMPPDRPIYLSADFDVRPYHWPQVADALRGAASVIGADRVGIYGGRWPIAWAQHDQVARWFWQTYAWSGGIWVSGIHIRQYKNGVSLAGAVLDLDEALVTDYGQWTAGGGTNVSILDAGDVRRVWQNDVGSGGMNMQDNVFYGRMAAQEARDLVKGMGAELVALRSVVEQLAAIINGAGGSADAAAILAGVDERLATLRAAIDADTKDTTLDALRAGAAGVETDNI